MARQTKIQLLIRREEEKGFEVRAVPSARAYLQYRPQRIPAPAWELAQLPKSIEGQVTYVLKNKATDRYLLLTAPEYFLWEQMDGRTSLHEMATAYVLRYGAFDFDLIPSLIAKLQRAQFLTLRPVSRLREVLSRHQKNLGARTLEVTLKGLEKLTLTSREVQRDFERVYRWGGLLLFTLPTRVGGVALTVLGVMSAIRVWNDAGEILAPLARHPILALLSVKAFFWVSVAAHQLLHGLACVHYGRQVREFGFALLHGFVPTFYVDVTDIFMATRKARVVTALAGPLVHLYLASLWFWVATQLPHGFFQSFAAATAIFQMQTFLVSLYPFCFLEMDGYHILVDLLGFPTLNKDSWRFFRQELWRRLADRKKLSRQEAIWVGYVVLSALSVSAFVIFNVWGLVQLGSS
ncbi:MAG: M50 family metallopeptidase [Candidatus Rokubacteria bacterium]|nr:M50 family metallopeptidase [Candidatus Rokubacteria bacterium]